MYLLNVLWVEEKGDGFNDLLNFINENKLNDRINLVGEVSHQKKIELFQSSYVICSTLIFRRIWVSYC